MTFSFLDDSNPEERLKALDYCADLLRLVAAVGGEACVFGDWENSEGCRKEVDLAKELGIVIRYAKLPT